jgi:adenylate cyclase class 2
MHFEVEQKFPFDDLPTMERRLIELGAIVEPPQEQVDRYFSHPCRDFAATDEALRIRRIGQENFVTWKGPKLDPTTKTRRELELTLEPGESGLDRFASLLEALGFRPVAEVRKVRRPYELHWDGRTVHAALDDVARVGTFVELELMVPAEEMDAARRCLASLARRLQLQHSERRSYLEMQLEKAASETSPSPSCSME